MCRRLAPVERVVGVAPDPHRVVGAHRLGRLRRGGFADADEVVLDRVEHAERLGLLRVGHEEAAPDRREDRLRLLGHLRVDERVVVLFTELGPLLVDDLHARLDLLEVVHERPRHVLAVGVVEAHRGHVRRRPLGHDLGRASSFHRRGRRDPEHVGVQLVGRRELVGLGDRGDEDDLVLLGHDRDGRPLGRGQRAD